MSKRTNVEKLLNKSYFQIIYEKYKWNDLYNIIFKFCSNHNIIISNYNINLNIINKQKYRLFDINKDFVFNLYSINPYKDAINLANSIYKEYTKFVVVTSYLDNKEIIISVNNYRVITFHLLFLYSNNIRSKLTLPTTQIGYYKKSTDLKSYNIYKITYTTDLIELIDICYKLYKPSYFLEFIKKSKLELDLKNNYDNINGYNIEYTYYLIIQNIIRNINNDTSINNLLVYKKINEIQKSINKEILLSINSENYIDIKIILLDKYAINQLYNIYKLKNLKNILDDEYLNNMNESMHIIAESKYIKLLLSIIQNYLDNNNLSHIYKLVNKESNYYIMNDFRLMRYNISIINTQTKNKISLLYVYNTLNYDIIPVVHTYKNILIPHPIVIIRFLIINLFNKILFDPNFNINQYNSIINLIKLSNDIIFNIHLDFVNKKTLISYYGNYVDERIEKFKLGSYIYKPWQYDLTHNKLLEIK